MEMDNPKPPHNHHQLKSKKPNKGKKKPVKVTYISSPMMVQANNASEFRAIVQQLTGKNSNLGRTCVDASATFGDDEDYGQVLDHGTSTDHCKAVGFSTDGDLYKEDHDDDDQCLNMIQSSLEFNESSFWREVSKSFGFQFPCVLV